MPGEQDEVDTSTTDDVDTSASEDDTTDDAQDDTGAGDDQETDSDSDSQDEDDSEEEDADLDAGDDADSDDGEDTEEEDEDDLDLDNVRPDLAKTARADEHFDIRKLPRDPETGLLDPEEANKAIQEHIDKQLAQREQNSQAVAETRDKLQKQWHKVQDRYPHIWKNKRLVEEVRDKHLGSFAEGRQYLSPLAAAKRVEKLYKLGVRSGTKQARSKRTVETIGRTPKGGGGNSGNEGDQTYANLRKQALSNDPAVAKKARIEVLKYRRNARQGS